MILGFKDNRFQKREVHYFHSEKEFDLMYSYRVKEVNEIIWGELIEIKHISTPNKESEEYKIFPLIRKVAELLRNTGYLN